MTLLLWSLLGASLWYSAGLLAAYLLGATSEEMNKRDIEALAFAAPILGALLLVLVAPSAVYRLGQRRRLNKNP